MTYKIIQTEVLIFGSGMAGNTAALELADKKINVAIVTKDNNVNESNTKYAQGGIVYKGLGDPNVLIQDILQAGDDLCDKTAVKILANEGAKTIEKILIKKLNIKFTKDINGNIHLTKEAAHSSRRIIHIKDQTGKIVEDAFISKLKNNKFVKIYSSFTLIDLVVVKKKNKKYCVGAYVLNNNSDEVSIIYAKKIILATGGVGQLYKRTVNSEVARGDGVAIAHRAGAKIKNAEFIQFHPTSLYHKDKSNFLISEALRGEGAILKNYEGKPFIEKYDPRGSLAPRDIVTRAIYWELKRTKKNCVYLDTSKISKEKIKSHFSNIYKTCLGLNLDIIKNDIPVAPTAHYFCGGIKVNVWGKTNINNLYAIGEVAHTGVHGANRLASTSLLECLVWGDRVARNITSEISKKITRIEKTASLIFNNNNKGNEVEIKRTWIKLRKIMWDYVGIIRNKKDLARASSELKKINLVAKKLINENLNKNSLGLYNGAMTALIIAKSALNNKQSRGCHYLEK